MIWIYICLAVVFILIGIGVGSLIDVHKYIKEHHKIPYKFKTSVTDPKKINETLTALQNMNAEEVDFIIANLFGRPIKIIKGVSPDGSFWLSAIQAMDASEDDFPDLEEKEHQKYVG